MELAVPHKVKSSSKHRTTVIAVISLQGNAKGKREYASITIAQVLSNPNSNIPSAS